MDNLILISIILATAIIPVIFARRQSFRDGFRLMLIVMAIFIGFYVLALLIIVPRVM